MQDCEEFIETMIAKNPAERITLMRLKNTMFPGLFLGKGTK
jgi:hypothetical protein